MGTIEGHSISIKREPDGSFTLELYDDGGRRIVDTWNTERFEVDPKRDTRFAAIQGSTKLAPQMWLTAKLNSKFVLVDSMRHFRPPPEFEYVIFQAIPEGGGIEHV